MKKGKKSWLIGINHLLSALLVLLGFSACGNNDFPEEYGTPHATYEIKGKVVDKVSKGGIQKLKVEMGQPMDDNTILPVAIPVLSGTGGDFLIRNSNGFGSALKYKITVTDTDGIDNGGQFKTQTIEVDFTGIKYVGGDGHWFQGVATKTVDIELDKE